MGYMGRWEPDARGRLSRAALELSAERGYDHTTVADIAAAAGVTERTFYRYFPDKADAFFPDASFVCDQLESVAERESRAGQPALAASRVAVQALVDVATQEPQRILLTTRLISSTPALVGRDLVRFQQFAHAIGLGLTRGGVPPMDAELAAAQAMAIWSVAISRWADQPDRPLGDVVRDAIVASAELNRGADPSWRQD